MSGITRALNQFFDATLDLSSSGGPKARLSRLISISWPKLQLLVATCDSTVTWAASWHCPRCQTQGPNPADEPFVRGLGAGLGASAREAMQQ